MSGDALVQLERCSKFFLADYDAGRRYHFARMFWGRRRLSDKLRALAVYVLKHIDLTVHVGERLNVVGPADSGKTMLGYLLAGLLTPSEGAVQRVGRVAYFSGIINFAPRLMTPREYVGFSVFLSGLGGEVHEYAVDELLATSGLEPHANRYLRDVPIRLVENLRLELLSRSRVKALVLDEPRDDVWDALARRPDFDALTIVVLSRRPRADLFPFERIAVLSAGELVYDGKWREGLPVYEDVMAKFAESQTGRDRGGLLGLDESDDEGAEDLELDEDGDESPVAPPLTTPRFPPPERPGKDELNAKIRRTCGDRRGKGAVRVERVWTTPEPTSDEVDGRLTLLSGQAQTLYIWLRVLDPQTIGTELRDLVIRLANPQTEARLVVSSSAIGWTPSLDREHDCLAFPITELGLPPGDYGIRITVETTDGVQDRVAFAEVVTVV
jgi:ABC-type polysaccharide/polyol phosphate transport system ATPase subunit